MPSVKPPKSQRDESLKFFFDDRAAKLSDDPDWAELCFASGREPRLWTRPELYGDLMESLRAQLDLRPGHELLEVGSAAGFLAKGLAAMCGRYTGIDLAPVAVEQARKLKIPNATFLTADATDMPFEDGRFDRVICHDVFTNFDGFEIGRRIMLEMARVLKPGGRMMVGSVPDEAVKEPFQQQVYRVQAELEKQYGPVPAYPDGKPGLLTRARHWYLRRVRGVRPDIVCYYFRKADFLAFGKQSGLETAIEEIHALNPYRGFRFNAVYTKRAA